MQKLTLHLPKYRLQLFLKVIKRRKSSMDEPIIPTKKRLNLKYRVGGYTRKFFRYLFEHKAVKKLFGANIAFMLVASSFLPTLASDSQSITDSNIIKTEAPLHTTVAIQNPVESVRITQGYKLFHPGIDIDGITGDLIKPIENGIVETVEHTNIGYGRHIIINHGNNLKSLYAHLSKTNVKIGDKVTTDTILGEMGDTGRSSGDHLHLEVRDHGVPINPLSVLPIF